MDRINEDASKATNTLSGVQCVAMIRRNAQSLAAYWWGAFITSPTKDEAYVAWALLLSCVDRRFWIWQRDVVHSLRKECPEHLWEMKMAHVNANIDDLKRSMKDREQRDMEQMDRHLFGWGTPARVLDMSLLPS